MFCPVLTQESAARPCLPGETCRGLLPIRHSVATSQAQAGVRHCHRHCWLHRYRRSNRLESSSADLVIAPATITPESRPNTFPSMPSKSPMNLSFPNFNLLMPNGGILSRFKAPVQHDAQLDGNSFRVQVLTENVRSHTDGLVEITILKRQPHHLAAFFAKPSR